MQKRKQKQNKQIKKNSGRGFATKKTSTPSPNTPLIILKLGNYLFLTITEPEKSKFFRQITYLAV